jgi:hypothetical protein
MLHQARSMEQNRCMSPNLTNNQNIPRGRPYVASPITTNDLLSLHNMSLAYRKIPRNVAVRYSATSEERKYSMTRAIDALRTTNVGSTRAWLPARRSFTKLCFPPTGQLVPTPRPKAPCFPSDVFQRPSTDSHHILH